MTKKTSYLVSLAAILIALSAGLSQISAQSGNPCGRCHGSYYQYLDILEGDSGNRIPTAINIGETKNVTVGIQNLSNAASRNTMSGVSLTLKSQYGRFAVKASDFSVGSLPVGKKTATWQITGLSAGTDSLLITAQGANVHESLSFTDSYSPAPSITVTDLPSASPTITLSTPSGGEMWLVGSRHNITWTAGGGTGTLSIRLDYTTGSSGPWISVANNEPNDGVFLWTVPNATSTNAYVRAFVVDSAIPPQNASSTNSAPFTITAKLTPVISITSPHPGLVWSGGNNQTIAWNSNAKDIGNCQVTLSYSTDNFDDSDELIASLIPDTGSYNWTPPRINSGSVRIKAVMRDPDGQTSEHISEPFELDSNVPNVATVEPSNASENVATSATLSVTFSEGVSASTAEQAFSIKPEASGISWNWDSQQQTMTATNVLLSPNTAYTATISAGVTDSSNPGNTNSKAFSWSFTTGSDVGSIVTGSSQPPVIIVDIREPQILVNEPATFDASKTFDPDNDTLVFSWDFGHNNSAVVNGSAVALHSFPADGIYNVLLRVGDGSAESLQAMEITVRKPQTTAESTTSFDWYVVWSGLFISIAGVIGVGRSAFMGTTEPLNVMTDLRSERAIQKVVYISSVLPTLLLRPENCVGCGFCAKKCPVSAITIADKKPLHDPSKCRGCMECANRCPRGSITIIPAKTSSPIETQSSISVGKSIVSPLVGEGKTGSIYATELSMLPTLFLREENCAGCGLCSKKCPNNAITMIDKRPAHDPSKCRACMECVKVCARRSITIRSGPVSAATASPGR